MQTIVNLVSAGLGLALVPQSMTAAAAAGGGLSATCPQPSQRAHRAARPACCGGPSAAGGAALRRPSCASAARLSFALPSRSRIHARASPIQSHRPATRAGGDPLVRHHLPGGLRAVPVARRAARRAAAVRQRRLDAQRRRGPAVLRRARRGDRRAPRLRAVLQAGLLRRAPAGGVRGLEGRHGLPRRVARRDRRDGAVRASSSGRLPAGDGPDRALRAHRAWRRGASATSSTASCGAARPTRACPGRWSSRSRAATLPRHPSPLYQFALEGLLLFVLLWWYARKPRGPGQVSGAVPGRLRACSASSPSSSASPTASSACWRSNMSMGQWLCVPMIVAGACAVVVGRPRTLR